MINAFKCGMTYEALVHALSHEIPCMTWELMGVTTQYATGDEAV
jgi:hypothetical protein